MQQRELSAGLATARHRIIRRSIVPAALALAIAALALYAYRNLLARPFAADDYQWSRVLTRPGTGALAKIRMRTWLTGDTARPLVWLLFWAQGQLFGLDPRGYHAMSLALHLLNAALLGWLTYRSTKDQGPTTKEDRGASSSFVLRLSSGLLAAGIVALHPAPFEAVVWVSAQSELLAATLLLAALHLWLPRPTTDGRRPTTDGRRWTNDQRPTTNEQTVHSASHASRLTPHMRPLLATLALALALLAKESAAIGLPLLFLVDRWSLQTFSRSNAQRLARYLLPALVTLAYVALQVTVERRNYLLAQGGYGLGPQIILNPLRSLALIAAPLPGSEHADAAWLVLAGAIVALLIILWVFNIGFRSDPQPQLKAQSSKLKTALALGLTLLPTAEQPDWLLVQGDTTTVMAAALLVARTIDERPKTKDQGSGSFLVLDSWSSVLRRGATLLVVVCALALAWWAAGELHAREGRFAAAAGPGGSLWRLAESTCAEGRPDRMVIVEPPLAPPHAEAIVSLACGPKVKIKIVGREQVDGAIKGRSIVVEFPGGSAQVVRRS